MKNVKNQYTFLANWGQDEVVILKEKSLLHQLKLVLRIQEGMQLLLLNGKGAKLLVQIRSVETNQIICQKIQEKQSSQIKPLWHLVLGTPKKEALKEVLRFGTQLGAMSFHLFDAQYSQWKSRQYEEKREHFLDILKESLEQSQRLYLPTFHTYPSWKNFRDQCSANKDDILVADLSDPESPLENSLCNYIHPDQKDIYLVIGPEGGWSSQEREEFSKDAHFYTLSPYILRLQTAAIASLVAAQTILDVQNPSEP